MLGVKHKQDDAIFSASEISSVTQVVFAAWLLVASSPDSSQAKQPKLDFDFLGDPAPVAQVDDKLVEKRRWMLTLHQGVGFGLTALMAGTMVSGQLNYSDRFAGPSSGRFETVHGVLAASTLAAFAAAGLLAYLAPVPLEKKAEGIDRVTLHKIGMIGATVGMVAQGVLGVATQRREGYANQGTLAVAHLAIGYATLACMVEALGALVF